MDDPGPPRVIPCTNAYSFSSETVDKSNTINVVGARSGIVTLKKNKSEVIIVTILGFLVAPHKVPLIYY